MSLKDALLKLVLREDLSRDEARAAMRSLVDGEATPSQIAAFAIALRMKGETAEEIAVRTVFNILGPLANPAGARRQLTGVAVPGLGETVARVLDLLGAEHAIVVHGQDGLDEISVWAPTQVHEARGGQLRSYTIEPE